MKVSYSGISAYRQCPRKYQFIYIDKIPSKPAPALFFGSVIHECLEYLHRPDDGQKEPRTLAHLLERLDQVWAPPEEFTEATLAKNGYSRDRAELLLTEYFVKNVGLEPGRSREPVRAVAVEKYFKAKLDPDDKDSDVVSGLIDRIDKTDSGYEVIDYKTNKKEPPSYHYERDLQLPIYKWAAEEALSLRPVTKVSFFYVVPEVNKKVTPDVPYDIAKTKEIVGGVITDIKKDIKRFEDAGREFEASRNNLCDWCDFKKICPAFLA
ncbi:MAG: PD-(D/E)XK nuclease family protein [Actinomycetota bacterium]